MTPLLIDADPGVDDAFAITLAALDPTVDLLGVTTVYGNAPVELTTANAGRVLALCERGDVHVAAGAHRPLVHLHGHPGRPVHGTDGLSGQSAVLPNPAREPENKSAAEVLADILRAAPEPVTIAAIGPLTNIALLLACYPDVAERIARLVVMGGAVAGGNRTAAAEFNILSDPEAARRVLVGEALPTTLVPVDVTYRCALGAGWLDELVRSGPRGAALHALLGDYREHYRAALGFDGVVLHDAVAVAEAIHPGLARTQRYPLEVDCSFGPSRGATIADTRRHGARVNAAELPEVAVATEVDHDRLHTVLRGLLEGLR